MPSDGAAVRLTAWRLDETPQNVAALGGLLSADEQDRASAFLRPDLLRRFVVARGRLRERLGAALGMHPRLVVFRYGPNGKPAVEGIEFNLAHSGELALLATASQPIGVDLERVRPKPSAPDLARRWFHTEEIKRIETDTQPLAAFYRTWVAKEAALKLIGVGVGESLPKLLTPEGATGWATGLPPNAAGLARCWVASIDVGHGCAASVATAEPVCITQIEVDRGKANANAE